MLLRRMLAVGISAALVLSLASCGGTKVDTKTPVEATAVNVTQEVETTIIDGVAVTVPLTDVFADLTETQTNAAGETVTVPPAELTKAQIVARYKAAADKSHTTAKTYRNISLVDFSINNGQYEKAINLVMPIISKLLANNSAEVPGITGGFRSLTEADVKAAKMYSVGDKTVIEMVMNEQTSGARDNALSGSVGHAITAVGDIGVVIDQITDLGIPLEISDEHTVIKYTNPTVKVLIDSNGKIVNGTWSYTVAINLNQFKVGKKTVDTTQIVMNNVLTVNGGFKK